MGFAIIEDHPGGDVEALRARGFAATVIILMVIFLHFLGHLAEILVEMVADLVAGTIYVWR